MAKQGDAARLLAVRAALDQISDSGGCTTLGRTLLCGQHLGLG